MEKNGGLETELRLGLPGGGGEVEKINEKKRVFDECRGGEEKAAVHKSQVVGWPPVAAFRRKNGFNGGGKMYVKVSMDGAPFLRKVDLNMQKGYSELARALEDLFGCFGMGELLLFYYFCFHFSRFLFLGGFIYLYNHMHVFCFFYMCIFFFCM